MVGDLLSNLVRAWSIRDSSERDEALKVIDQLRSGVDVTSEVEVPQEWNDVDGSPWLVDRDNIGATLSASTDLEGFNNCFDTPGLFFGASRLLVTEYDADGFLDLTTFGNECTLEGRYEYDDGFYVGSYDLFVECGGTGTSIVNIAATPEDGSYMVWVIAQIVTDADVGAFTRIVETFQVVGELP
jgi:serine protease Do